MATTVSISVANPADALQVSPLLAAGYPPLMRAAYDKDTLKAVLPAITRANHSLLKSGA